MATLTATNYTLVEKAKGLVGGNVISIAEVLEKKNPFLKDAPWVEANDTMSHVVQIRTSLPSGTRRQFNGGISDEEPTSQNKREAIEMLEALAKADKALIDISPNPKKERFKRVKGFLLGLSNSMMSDLLYGNSASNPVYIDGLATRYNSLSLDNVTDNGGSGSYLTSAWIIEWGEETAYLIYPKSNKNLGIEDQDLGVKLVDAPDGNGEMLAYVNHFKIWWGLAVEDDRAVQRIANIDTSGTTPLDIDKVVEAMAKLPNMGSGAVMYVNRDVYAQLAVAAMNKQNGFYTAKDIFGRPVTMFQTMPIHLAEGIINESAVS